MYSNLTPYQNELLTILIEECGEVVQEVCKIKRFGILEPSHNHPGFSHLQCLEQELGDIQACVQLLRDATIGITTSGLEEAKERKLAKMAKWMKHHPDSQ